MADLGDNVTALAALVGRSGRVTVRPGMTCDVRVIDAKRAYGATRVLVAAISGEGEAWIELANVIFDDVAV